MSRKKKLEEEEEEAQTEEAAGGGWQRVKGGVACGRCWPMTAKPKMSAKDADIKMAVVLKKLSEIVARGKKGTDRREQVEMLHEPQTAGEANNLGVGVDNKIKHVLMEALYNYNPKISGAMKYREECLQCSHELSDIINARPSDWQAMAGKFFDDEIRYSIVNQ